MRCAEPWVAPYVVQLIGEHVLEILVAIDHGLPGIAFVDTTYHDRYGQFLAANPTFFATTERRVVSYWSRYYRRLHSDSYAPRGFRELHGYC